MFKSFLRSFIGCLDGEVVGSNIYGVSALLDVELLLKKGREVTWHC
jgi:hypothetical protein